MKASNHYFMENLNVLVGCFPSVVQASEVLGINRQQLTKYLSGINIPSFATLRSIAAYFGVEPDDLFLPSDEFNKRWSPPVKIQGLPSRIAQSFQSLLQHMHQSHADMDQLCGYYHTYIGLLTHPDKVGRAYTVIRRHGDFTTVKTLMFANALSAQGPHRIPVKIEGMAFNLGERIYILDTQNVGQSNARFQSIALYPFQVPAAEYLTGMLLTTNNARNRPIYSTPIVFQRLKTNRIRKEDLRACGVFFRDRGDISPQVLRLLDQSERQVS